MIDSPTLLILGIGNTLRGDDGAGAWICAQLEQEILPHVVVETAMQLYPEHLHQFMSFNAVLIVDASVEANTLMIERIDNTTAGNASSHHQDLPTLKALARQLYGTSIELYACHIPALQFDLGQPLSATAAAYAQQALLLIRNWITLQQNKD